MHRIRNYKCFFNKELENINNQTKMKNTTNKIKITI